MSNCRKILVTGGAGFVGSHLIQKLVQDKSIEVYSLDDYSSGSLGNHIEGAHYINGNTKDIDTVLDFVPCMIYHLGQYSRTSASFSDPNFVWEHNCLGTFKVVQYCRKNKVRLLYSASSTKMADDGEGRNQSPYSWSKSTNVELIKRYGEWYGLDYVIVYFYNVYGGREVKSGQYATLIAIWKQLVKRGQKLKIVSPGTQVRSFTFIQDIIKGIIAAGEQGKGDGYELGASQVFTLWEVAAMFGYKDREQLEILPERPGDRKRAIMDLSKTISDLKWKAHTRLEDHIAQFMEQIKSRNPEADTSQSEPAKVHAE